MIEGARHQRDSGTGAARLGVERSDDEGYSRSKNSVALPGEVEPPTVPSLASSNHDEGAVVVIRTIGSRTGDCRCRGTALAWPGTGDEATPYSCHGFRREHCKSARRTTLEFPAPTANPRSSARAWDWVASRQLESSRSLTDCGVLVHRPSSGGLQPANGQVASALNIRHFAARCAARRSGVCRPCRPGGDVADFPRGTTGQERQDHPPSRAIGGFWHDVILSELAHGGNG